MAVSDDHLRRIDGALGGEGAAFDVSTLRRDLSGLSITRCDPSDVDGEPPFREYDRYALYLVDGRDHCVQLCRDPGTATGIVVVAKKQPKQGRSPQ
jgi:hypothetical protein